MKIRKVFKTTSGALGTTFRYFKKNPRILIPFFIVGLFDAFILALIYLAPRPPLSALFAPPIKAFWGEHFLHYPFNFFLIPLLYNYGHIISTAFIGVLMTGLVIGMLHEAKQGSRPSFLVNLIKSIKMYLRLLFIWGVVFCLVSIVFKGLPFVLHLKQRTALQIAFYVSFLIGILIEVIFIYAMPAIMIEKKRLWSGIKTGIIFCKNTFMPTLLLVAIPTLVYIPMLFLKGKLPFLMSKLFPEVVLILLGLGIVVSVVINCLITCSTTVLFLEQRRA